MPDDREPGNNGAQSSILWFPYKYEHKSQDFYWKVISQETLILICQLLPVYLSVFYPWLYIGKQICYSKISLNQFLSKVEFDRK